MKAFSLILILSLFGRGVLSQGDLFYQGCYNGSGSLLFSKSDNLQSPEVCEEACTTAGNQTVEALTKATDCWCGNFIPTGGLVPDLFCDAVCPGMAMSACMFYIFPLLYLFIFVEALFC